MKNKGFTLIEILLAIAIFSVILLLVVRFYDESIRLRVKGESAAFVEEEAGAFLQIFSQAVKDASGINEPTQGFSGSILSLSFDQNQIDPTIFSFADNTVYISEGGGTQIPLFSTSTVNVTDGSFSNVGRSGTNGSVRVRFKVSRVNESNRNEYYYEKNFVYGVSIR